MKGAILLRLVLFAVFPSLRSYHETRLSLMVPRPPSLSPSSRSFFPPPQLSPPFDATTPPSSSSESDRRRQGRDPSFGALGTKRLSNGGGGGGGGEVRLSRWWAGRNNGGGIVHFKSPEGDRVERAASRRQEGRQSICFNGLLGSVFPHGALLWAIL